ncbi:hypothetical protein DE146DRAFT_618734 [Phaeosphaeria sp. MPI-PUGE-AT-0046c]|nr:hypothetical protein DE146DRAFT_618734 [Phaeosphaeria sp. MPI-PUGE-AT-0046c]
MATHAFDLQLEWRNACQEFIDATGIDLDVKSPTAEQITTKLDKLNEAKDAKSQSKVGKAKRAVGNTVRAIQTIGGLLVQGAQLTGFGGPANVTMNCVSFFIDAGFAYQKIAENIDDIFSRIGPIMERAEVYIKSHEVVGSEMELTTHRMLMAVVKTCQYCIRILRPPHHKRFKVQQFFEVAMFHSDQGVQEQINTLVTLEEQELKMAGAVTVTTVKTTAADVKIVEADVKNVGTGVTLINERLSKSDAATAQENMRKEFKAKLGVDESMAKALQAQYRGRRERLKTDTCAWLRDNSHYTQWSDPQKKSAPVLILSGDEGTGKSYAMTSIVQDLERRYPQGRDDSTRISVAYFYFTRNAQSIDDSQDGQRESRGIKTAPPVKEMLRTWASQVMENDTFYRKDVLRSLRDDSNFDELDHFLQKLFLDQLPNGAVFFLLLDETHDLDEEGCSELSKLLGYLTRSSADLSSLRILMTMKPALQRELQACAASSTVAIRLEHQNQQDIQTYVEFKTDMLACFQSSSTQIQELKAWVIAELPAAVNGNFLLVDRKLQEINNCQDVEDVRRIIEKMKKEGANMFDSIDKDVRDCNKTLSTKQVRNVNALLLWVIYAATEFRVYQLEAILYVQEQHKAFQPLAKELKEQYSAFFNLEGFEDLDAIVKIKSSAHAEYFKEVSKQRRSTESSLDQSLSKGQIQVVQHFVKKLCEQDLYDKLGLAEFFDQKLSQSGSLAGDYDYKAQAVRSYSGRFLAEHLKQIDLDTVDPSIKTEMGPLIVKLFTNEQTIKISNSDYPYSWSYNDAGLTEIARLLKSSAVIKNVVRNDKVGETWINMVLRAKEPEAELLAAQKPAMAKYWVEEESPRDIEEAFLWWIGYHNRIEHKENQRERLTEPPQIWDRLSSHVIDRIYDEHIEPVLIGMGSTGLKGKRNLGITFWQLKHVAKAIALLTNVLDGDPDDLIARNALADAYATAISVEPISPNWDEALRHKDLVIEQLRAGKKFLTRQDPDTSLRYLLSEKGTWLRQLKRYEESRALLYELLNDRPEDHDVRLELVRTLCHCKRFSEVRLLLQAMEKDIDPSNKLTAVSRFLHSHALDDSCHALLVSAYRHEEQLEELKNYYRVAIKDCANDEYFRQWQYHLLINQVASIFFRFGSDVKDREEAIEMWEQVVRELKSGDSKQFIDIDRYIIQLSKAYVAQALEAGPGSPVAEEMLRKIRAFLTSTDKIEIDDDDQVSQSEVRSLLARYYRAVGDRTKAQETVRLDMELGLKLLSDNDPENDWQGYYKVATALMDVGATEESQAAWSLIQPTQGISHLSQHPALTTSSSSPVPSSLDDNQYGDAMREPLDKSEGDADVASMAPEDANSAPDPPTLKRANTTMSLTGPLICYCDGQCGTFWTYADDCYVCSECLDVWFDEACLKKFYAGELDREFCDHKHKFLHVPAWTIASAERARDGRVLVGNLVKDIKSWLEEIRQAWKLESSIAAFVST